MKTHKAVLWDLDGTIIDSISVMTEILDEILPKIGLPNVSREKVRLELHGSLEDALSRMIDNHHDQTELLKHFFEAQIKHYENPITHIGIHDVIKELNQLGVKQAIVTSRMDHNRDAAGAKAIVKTLKLNLHIATIISGDDSQYHKPHPEPLLLALAELGVTPDNAVMIGDQLVDAQAAHAAGTYSILIDHDNTPETQQIMQTVQPNSICTDASQLMDSVRQLLKV